MSVDVSWCLLNQVKSHCFLKPIIKPVKPVPNFAVFPASFCTSCDMTQETELLQFGRGLSCQAGCIIHSNLLNKKAGTKPQSWTGLGLSKLAGPPWFRDRYPLVIKPGFQPATLDLDDQRVSEGIIFRPFRYGTCHTNGATKLVACLKLCGSLLHQAEIRWFWHGSWQLLVLTSVNHSEIKVRSW